MNSLADFLAELLLESDAPEEDKIGVRIIQQAGATRNAVGRIVSRFADPEKEVAYDDKKQALEYLRLVELGINQFLETFNQH